MRPPASPSIAFCFAQEHCRQGISEGLCGIIMQYLRRRTWNFPAPSLPLALRDLPVAYFPSESFFYMRRTFMEIMERARRTNETFAAELSAFPVLPAVLGVRLSVTRG